MLGRSFRATESKDEVRRTKAERGAPGGPVLRFILPPSSLIPTVRSAWLTATAGRDGPPRTAAGDAELFALNRGTLGPAGSTRAKADRATCINYYRGRRGFGAKLRHAPSEAGPTARRSVNHPSTTRIKREGGGELSTQIPDLKPPSATLRSRTAHARRPLAASQANAAGTHAALPPSLTESAAREIGTPRASSLRQAAPNLRTLGATVNRHSINNRSTVFLPKRSGG